MKISEARGVILLACAHKGMDSQVFEYTPMQVKLAVTGYGRSDKKEVLKEVEAALKPARSIGSKKKDGFDDAADQARGNAPASLPDKLPLAVLS